MTKINIDLAINSFRSILTYSMPVLEELISRDKTESFFIDWLQANWEMIVEASIPAKLAPRLRHYGEGADCNGMSYRVWQPDDIANYEVICIPKDNHIIVDALSGEKITGKFILDEFCTIKDGWYFTTTPFDYAKIHIINDNMPDPCIIDINHIKFEAWLIEKESSPSEENSTKPSPLKDSSAEKDSSFLLQLYKKLAALRGRYSSS